MNNVLGISWEELWADEEQEETVEVKNVDPPPCVVIPDDLFRTPCRMIKVVVGKRETATTFVVHEPLLRASSTYLATRLDMALKNGDDFHILELASESPKIFGLVNRYLYTGVIPSQDWQYLVPFPLYPLCDIWLLANDLGMSNLVNYVIWCLLQRLYEKRIYDIAATLPANIEIIYNHAPTGSKLQKLLVDMCVWDFEDYTPSARAPRRMCWDLYEALRQKNKATESPLRDARNYYTMAEEIEPRRLVVECTSSDWKPETVASVSHTEVEAEAVPKPPVSQQASETPYPETNTETTAAPAASKENPSMLRPKSEAKAEATTERSDPNPTAVPPKSTAPAQSAVGTSGCLPEGSNLALNSTTIVKSKVESSPFSTTPEQLRREFAAAEQTMSFSGTTSVTVGCLFGAHKLPLPPFIPEASPTSAPDLPPACTGTTSVQYTPRIEKERQGKDIHHSICAQDAYRNFSPEELRLADTKPKEIITISDDESDAESVIGQDWKSKVKVKESWRWREYSDPNTAKPTSKKAEAASRNGLRPENSGGRAPLTPPPSTQKPPRSSRPTAKGKAKDQGKETDRQPTVEELRELGRAYRMRHT